MTIPKKYLIVGVYFLAGVTVVLGVLLCWLLGWDLFLAPVFHLPTIGFFEALGAEFLIAPLVAGIVALREVDK